MRPALLSPLFTLVGHFYGIGPKLSVWIQKVCGPYARDVLFHFPSGIHLRPQITQFPMQQVLGTLQVTITQQKIPHSKRLPLVIEASSPIGNVQIVFFHYHIASLSKKLAVGLTVWISGHFIPEHNTLKIVHPDYIENDRNKIPKIETIYPLKMGANGKIIRRLVAQILPTIPVLPEEIDTALLQQKNWPSWHDAILAVHQPIQESDLIPQHPARERLSFDELFANQIALHLIRQHNKKQVGLALPIENKISLNLPFHLTNAQEKCLEEIQKDLASNQKMTRLLQGDVGSGKTIVAVLAALQAIGNRTQAAFLAPTDLLAHQHFEKIKALCTQTNVAIELLTAQIKGKKRIQILSDLAKGKIDIVIGTHALLEENVRFYKLGLAIIDEQHRFGVKQRLALSEKEKHTNVLVMSATPIPRTLALTAYGDMDISILNEKPKGRQEIDTRVIPLTQIDTLIQHIKNTSQQIYWVCPLVEESEKSDLMAAEKRHQNLQKIFGPAVGLIHGKMSPADKEMAMDNFIQGRTKILVSTTVIEVGIDVPTAGIMIVEHAERFGLATLHQLRGRVGRGHEKAACLLLHGRLSNTAKERLSVLRDTNDGFKIAEADLKLRGAGEVLGIRQSGLPEFRLANIIEQTDLFQLANQEAIRFLSRDPNLQTNRGQALKNMLYLFGKDKEIHFLKAG